MHHLLRNVLFYILQCTLFHKTSAFPFSDRYDLYNGTAYDGSYSVSPRKSKRSLRIMPLGASVTRGEGPPEPYNGYRKPLRDQLRFLGYPVNMIGCLADGDFNDNQHEGHRGAIISELISKNFVSCSIDQKPNLVLINLGSNDCSLANQKTPEDKVTWLAGAHDRMLELLNYVYDHSDGVFIILSTLLPNGDPAVDPNVKVVNAGYRRLVQELASQGKKIQLAEMDNGFINAPADLAPNDPTHPNAGGYLKMAAVWADAIAKAESKIRDPIDIGIPDTGTSKCMPAPNQFNGPHQTQRGSGFDDGPYIHSQESTGEVILEDIIVQFAADPSSVNNYHFAQLVNAGQADRGGEFDEVIRVINPAQRVIADYTYMAYKLSGHYDDEWVEIKPGHECLNEGVHWGDINNDGLDDFICLEPDMHVSINLGTIPPTFKYIGMIKAADPGTTKFNILLGDIDGDGRIDYCAQDPSGSFGCWRNGGYGLAPTAEYGGYWQGIAQGGGATFDGKGMPDTKAVRLVDINGDGRADWVYQYDDGHTRIFTNQRGTKADGPGIKPVWTEATAAHPAFTVGGKTKINRDYLRFARIEGSGRADQIRLVEEARNVFGVIQWTYKFYLQKNTGFGGKRLRGDGVRYCDMFGRKRDDYLWVFSTGEIYLYGNEGTLPDWKQYAQVLVTGRPRQSIHVGDWDGDGHCDILSVDRHTGQVDMWRNTWQPGQEGITFEYRANVARGCTEGWGVGLFDVGPRFADVDGDGRVDYLCMKKDGYTTGILNTATGLQDVGQIKVSVGLDRANHQFADVDGDGRADFLWVDKFTGDVKVWINAGKIPSSGSAFLWVLNDGIWMKGVDRGANMHFAKMSPGGKRNDFLQVLPATTAAYAWYNTCPGGSGGDDGPLTDPGLPTLPSIICPRANEDCDDGFDPDRPLNWVVMGDSYSAGPGAGPAFDENDNSACYRTDGAYGPQLQTDFPWFQQAFDFLACTGATTQDMLDSQISSLARLPKTDLVLLSIGGNDAFFSQVIKSCVLGIGFLDITTCDSAITKAYDVFRSDDFRVKLYAVWDGIFGKLAGDYHYQVYHVLYPKLFSDQESDTWCNDQRFIPLNPLASKLDRPFRKKMNDLADSLNFFIAVRAEAYSIKMLNAPGWEGHNRLFTIRPNDATAPESTWNGHRFCEPGATNFVDPSIYVIPWSGQNARMGKRQLSEDNSKVFHPRQVGFSAMKNQIKAFLLDNRPAFG